MEEVFEYPPIIEEIDAVFNIMGKPIIYAWGKTLFNPLRVIVPPSLVVHEETHGKRQGDDIKGWWVSYLRDPDFRLFEEVLAHKAEYNHLIRTGNRRDRRRALKLVSGRLASPLYGNMISKNKAVSLLRSPSETPERMKP